MGMNKESATVFPIHRTCNKMYFMYKNARFNLTLIGELLCLLLAAPALYFPNWFPTWTPWVSLALLGISWLWRSARLGCWLVRTPADWPMFFLFAVMLPVAVWAAPEPLRAQYSFPRSLILVWNFCLFYTVALHTSLRPSTLRGFIWVFIVATAVIALLAPLGIEWANKFPFLAPIYNSIPTVLRGFFAGAERGFHGNQVAGTLLYVLPLLYALVLFAPTGQRLCRPVWWLLGLLALYMTGVLVLTQSRAGLLGFGAGMLVLLLLPVRWGRWGLVVAGFLVAVSAPFWLNPVLNFLGSIGNTALDTSTLTGREEVWSRALYGIQDFVFTGMGLGTFRAIMPVLYPMFLIAPDFDIAHAHNFFLQTALDLGLPGLMALLAIYIVAVVQIVGLWRAPVASVAVLPLQATWRTYAIGLAGCLVAQTVYSQLDAVTMGSKPNFLFWILFALIFGAANCALHSRACYWRGARL